MSLASFWTDDDVPIPRLSVRPPGHQKTSWSASCKTRGARSRNLRSIRLVHRSGGSTVCESADIGLKDRLIVVLHSGRLQIVFSEPSQIAQNAPKVPT